MAAFLLEARRERMRLSAPLSTGHGRGGWGSVYSLASGPSLVLPSSKPAGQIFLINVLSLSVSVFFFFLCSSCHIVQAE